MVGLRRLPGSFRRCDVDNVLVPHRQHPPLPSAVRPLFWVLRAFGVLVGAGGLYAAALAATQEKWSTAFLVLLLSGGFAALTWMHPLSGWFVPTLVGFGLAAAILAGSWTTALIVLGPAALILWFRNRPPGGRGARLNPDRIAIIEPGAVMRNARAFVAEFTAAGFEQVGALRFSFGPVNVIESLLLAPDGRSYAAVTDAIVHVTSLFPGGRALVTRNSHHARLPDYLLINSAPGGSPAELVASHAKALALVAEREHYPLAIAAPELPQIAIDGERAAIEWAATHRRSSEGVDGTEPLWSRPERYRQIDAWHGAGASEPPV